MFVKQEGGTMVESIEKRPFGNTGYLSSRAIFGSVCVGRASYYMMAGKFGFRDKLGWPRQVLSNYYHGISYVSCSTTHPSFNIIST